MVVLQTNGSIQIDAGNDYSVLDEIWHFRLIAISSESIQNSNVVFDFRMTFKDGCLMDNFSDPSSIDSLDYYVDFTEIYVISAPSFSQKVENCAIEW